MNLSQNVLFMQILDCLSIVAFFGATNPDETQNAMHNIWEYLNPESGYDVCVTLAMLVFHFLVQILPNSAVVTTKF